MFTNHKHSDNFMLAVIRDGVQKNYILHKSCVVLAMDAAWLTNPDGESQAGNYLATRETSDVPFGPLGYGCVLVSFDDKTVLSYQIYKDISYFTLSDVGHMGGAAPAWMDWSRVIDDAFDKECISSAIYGASQSSGQLRLALPQVVRERKALTLRFVSREKPVPYNTVGVAFSPKGWVIRHQNVRNEGPAQGNIVTRLVNNLRRLRASMAPESVWAGFTAFQ